MNADRLRRWVVAAAERLALNRDELTDLDAAAGDGDLGVTVASGATEVATALSALEPSTPTAAVLRAAGAAFARGNPSSFAALTGAGLLAAAATLNDLDGLDRASLVTALQAAADRIAERGRSTVGDRTMLDALVPSIDALRKAPAGLDRGLEAMISASRNGVSATAGMTPARGRAQWVGERAIGVPDGGATAYLRFLEALAETEPSVAS